MKAATWGRGRCKHGITTCAAGQSAGVSLHTLCGLSSRGAPEGKRTGRGTHLIVCHQVHEPVHGLQGLGCGQARVARGQGTNIDAGGMVPAQVV
jgi:hypothetical protein